MTFLRNISTNSSSTATSRSAQPGVYVCPRCKRHLRHEEDLLHCSTCSEAYAIREGIPDFIREKLSRSTDPVLHRMRFIDRMARIYESKLWYPVVLKLYGGWHSPSLPQLIAMVTGRVESVEGRVLDVACGPGTYGRRIASASKEVFGIDVSMGMLRQGAAYVLRQNDSHMHFARARVEALPFEDDFFDAALCCASLHLFADTGIALREISRVLRPATILSVFTFGAGNGGILKYSGVREWTRRNHGLHVFDLSELERCLTASGFEDFHPEMSGSILTFCARKRATIERGR